MSTKLLLLFLVLCASQLQTYVHGQKRTGLEPEIGKPYHGVRQSEKYMDQVPEYDREKGVFVRNKRAAAAPTPAPAKNVAGKPKPKPQIDPKIIEKIKKRVKGFVTVFGALTGTLIFLCFTNIGLFIWLSITLKKLKKA